MKKICIDNCFENNYAKLIIWQSERLKFAELMYDKSINECIEPYLVALFDARDSFFFYGWSLKFINYEGELPKFEKSKYECSFTFDKSKEYLLVRDEASFLSGICKAFNIKIEEISKDTLLKIGTNINALVEKIDDGIKEILSNFISHNLSDIESTVKDIATNFRNLNYFYLPSETIIYSTRNASLCIYLNKRYFSVSGYECDLAENLAKRNNSDIKNAFDYIKGFLNIDVICHLCDYTKGIIKESDNNVIVFHSGFKNNQINDYNKITFSCSEKKIISEICHQTSYNPSLALFFVTKEPCPTCRILIEEGASVVYLNDDLIVPYKVLCNDCLPIECNEDSQKLFYLLNDFYEYGYKRSINVGKVKQDTNGKLIINLDN